MRLRLFLRLASSWLIAWRLHTVDVPHDFQDGARWKRVSAARAARATPQNLLCRMQPATTTDAPAPRASLGPQQVLTSLTSTDTALLPPKIFSRPMPLVLMSSITIDGKQSPGTMYKGA